MAKSRMSSSALGALSQSTSLAVGNSRPMQGVRSFDSYNLLSLDFQVIERGGGGWVDFYSTWGHVEVIEVECLSICR
jgi:hypothetical protein